MSNKFIKNNNKTNVKCVSFMLEVIILLMVIVGCSNVSEAKTQVEVTDSNVVSVITDTPSQDTQPTYAMEFVRYMDSEQLMAEYRDTETGVHYIVFVDSDTEVNIQKEGNAHGYGLGTGVGKGMGAGIIPRYDSDKQVYVEDAFLVTEETTEASTNVEE